MKTPGCIRAQLEFRHTTKRHLLDRTHTCPMLSCLGWDEVTESQGVRWEIQARQSKPRLRWHGSPYPAAGSLKNWMSSDPVYAYSVADKAHRTDCLGHSLLSCRFSEKVYFFVPLFSYNRDNYYIIWLLDDYKCKALRKIPRIRSTQ